MSMGRAAAFGLLALLAASTVPATAQSEQVDLALVLAVDVSESIDAARYTLQMDGIAAALETPEVQASVLSGPHQSMMIALVQWSNRPALSLPWTLLTSGSDVRQFAARVRHLRRASNGFTCMSVALRSIADKLLTQLPVPAERTVVDVSGDGHDNCNTPETVDQVRDELTATGVTINGLPILEGDEAATLEAWYQDHVIGGPNAFLVPAASFDDFGRALRRKFVTEMSAVSSNRRVHEASR
jgi:Protein of unknown function (DUF1194)